jgi:two-component system chemotaxis response regulator CheY
METTEVVLKRPRLLLIWWTKVQEVEMEQFPTGAQNKDRPPARFLIVDDSAFARENLRCIIESFGGHLAGQAENGAAAIAEYERVRPDVVLMDITMPGMDGLAAVEEIMRRNPKARVIMVSSVGYQENITRALQRGARHFVQKPVKANVLYEVVKYVLADKLPPDGTGWTGIKR